ncbi:MAG TPA: MFS transporter [Pseudonocardia sp.]|nr:MFS transporter [Pseudonocardia sp.]
MTTTQAPPLLRGPLRTLVVGAVALVSLFAFEATGVATAMPAVATALDGLASYALAFGLPLATGVLGMVLSGAWSDARGPAAAMRAGVAGFVVGLLVAGFAPSMPVFAAGRALQGLGSGLLSVALYVVVGRVVPPEQRPRVFAAFAAAWVLPSVVGPPLAGFLTEHVGWRSVFLGAAVLAVPAALLVEPALRGLDRPLDGAVPASSGRAVRAVGAALGAVGLFQAGQLDGAAAAGLGAVAVLVLAVSVPPLLPAGTLRARRGLPAVVALRGLAAAAFFGAEAFLPLLLVRERGLSPAVAGLVLTAAAVGWATGSWIQGRERAPAPAVLLRAGSAAIVAGVLASAAAISPAVPVAVAVAGWLVAGLGMGLTYPTLSVLTLAYSAPAEQGANSSALQIADALFAAVVLAVSGALFAALLDSGLVAFAAGFAVAAAFAVLAVVVAGRTRA